MRFLNFSALLEKDPRNLLRLLMSVALLSIVLILFFSAFGIYGVYSQQLTANAEDDAVQIARAIKALEKEHFVRIDSEGQWSLMPEEDLHILDRRLRTFLKPFDILKIKLFNTEKRIVYSTDLPLAGRLDGENERLERALAGHNDSKLERKETVLDLSDEQRFDVDVVETYTPVFGPGGEVIGSFEIYRDVTRYRNAIQEGVLRSLAVLALILVAVFGASFAVVKIGTDQLERLQRRLQEMASRDPLTGVMNRREIINRTHAELARIERRSDASTQKSIGIIMLDVDHFKGINDTYGHPAGDQVLMEMSERIQGAVRKSDFVGRYGGEEFLVILPGASLETTRFLAERIRQVIRSKPFLFEGIFLKMTVSMGIAVHDGGEEEFSLSLKQADEALYEAKNGGRDQISTGDLQVVERGRKGGGGDR